VAFWMTCRECFSLAARASKALSRYGLGGLAENIVKRTNMNMMYRKRPRGELTSSIGTTNMSTGGKSSLDVHRHFE